MQVNSSEANKTFLIIATAILLTFSAIRLDIVLFPVQPAASHPSTAKSYGK